MCRKIIKFSQNGPVVRTRGHHIVGDRDIEKPGLGLEPMIKILLKMEKDLLVGEEVCDLALKINIATIVGSSITGIISWTRDGQWTSLFRMEDANVGNRQADKGQQQQRLHVVVLNPELTNSVRVNPFIEKGLDLHDLFAKML